MEEIMNAVTHGIGTALSLAGLIVLTIAAYSAGTVWHLVSFAIYGTSLVLLYLASTLYHSFRNEKVKYVFKICDHAAIYLLIAGTYTPFTLILLHGLLGWIVLSVIWTLAIIGVVLTIFFVARFKVLSTICYLIMGWLVIVAIQPLAAILPLQGLLWLIGGGLLYSVGSFFYLNRRIPYHHTVWHLFVMAGSAAHFVVVFYYVLPIPVAV
ncbi:MAG: channel protein, hemolysin family [Firmicutes bacterium]|nr:channel protein, hemolysin family [Bacillota bacterium]